MIIIITIIPYHPNIINISKKSGQETEISELLGAGKSASNSFNKVLFNTKAIEKGFIKLSDKVYMNQYEVTNVDYQKFLENLLTSRQLDLFKSCVYDSTAWTKFYSDAYMDPMKNMYHWHPAYDMYPIVNVTHLAAKQYCTWLTQQYNTQSKRKYAKVIFRLPTEKEWQYAAGSGNEKAKTYFINDEVKVEKCYLANLKYKKSADKGANFMDDGGFFTVKVDSYQSNKLGFYNMIGNVSEMINVQGLSKGGGWNSFLDESYIPLKGNYSEANPETGFRIVMEVIEE